MNSMQNKNSKLKEYIDIVQKVARVEHRRIPSHMVEYEELVSIGIIAVQSMLKDKTDEEMERYNSSYMATAVRWAIRNELRNRYKWYSLKHKKDEESEFAGDEVQEDGIEVTPSKVREAVYETILSIDSLAAANSDNDSPFDFVKDTKAMPDEAAEITEMGRMIKEAIATLPQKDRTIVEYRFYRNMQVKEIAQQVGLSSSRVTRIVQAALNSVREYLEAARLVKEKHPEVDFYLLGKYETEMQDAIPKEEIEQYINDGIVTRFDETNDVRPYYEKCSVYVLPSYREGTPRTVLEAMSMGRAVITTDTQGCRGTVIDGKTGYLVPVKNSQAVAEKMLTFIENPELISQMGAESAKYCREKFDVNIVNNDMCKYLNIEKE